MLQMFEGAQKAFWIVALVASVVFVIQTILTFIGLGGEADSDFSGDADDGGLSGVFSFRNLVNFLLGYGWTGVILFDDIEKMGLLQLVSIAVGLLFVLAFVFMLKQVLKLSHDGSFHIEEAVGVVADVYLRIPPLRSGRGKVQLSVRGSVHEIDAVTDQADAIPTGDSVKVVKAIGSDTLLVTKIN